MTDEKETTGRGPGGEPQAATGAVDSPDVVVSRPAALAGDSSGASVAKCDPEGLAIRARTPRVIRFRKGVIIGGASAAALVLSGVAWIALRPPSVSRGGEAVDLAKASPPKPDDALGNLPKTYADVPKLGQALPGDLGRPILSAQQAGKFGNGAEIAAEQDKQRREAERKKALESGLLASSSSTVGKSPVVENNAASLPSGDGEAPSPSSQSEAQSAADRKVQFANKLDTRSDANPHALSAGAANTLTAGSVIVASLITGINSDVPGMVIAQVTQNTYDSATGRTLLIPQGSRLIGNYDSVVAYGQQRALVVWQRLMLPDGTSLKIDNMPATDPSGQAGLQDKVNFHYGRLIKGVAIATLLGVGTELSISGESELVRALRESAQTNVSRAGDQITQRNLDVQPTIIIRPGATVRLVVRQDLVLKPWKEGA